MYNAMYMALHIADKEVDDLVVRLAALDHMTKTELLRRLLRRELAERELRERRSAFRDVATRIVSEARTKTTPPVTKEETDALWEVNGH